MTESPITTPQELISLRDPQLGERLDALLTGHTAEEALRTNRRLQEIIQHLEDKLADLLAERELINRDLTILERRGKRLRKRYALLRARWWLRALHRSEPPAQLVLPPVANEELEALQQAHQLLVQERDQLSMRLLQTESALSDERQRSQQLQDQLAAQETWRREQEQAIGRATNYDLEVAELKRQNQDREHQLRTAQLHLAKKVKEGTVVRDQLERQQMEIQALTQQLAQAESSTQQLNSHWEREHVAALSRIQAAEERAAKSDNQAQEWQEKLFAAQERWQEEKQRIRELERIESEYQQMVSAFSHLRSFTAPTLTLPQVPLTVPTSRTSRRAPAEDLLDLFQHAERTESDH